MNITASNIHFAYGDRPVLADVSLSMQSGEFICIVGPNGSGKSTLLKLLLGHLRPQSGSIELDGQNLLSLPTTARAQRVALVPQAGTIGFAYTVEQIILMARWPWRSTGLAGSLGFETAHDLQVSRDAMAAMDLTALAHRPVTELSGGERQRVLLARALAQQTPAILLDEPTSAMDIRHQLQMLAILRQQVRTQNKLVIFVTHDLNLAADWAERTVLMDAGRIVADGPTPTVIRPDLLEKVYGVQAQTAPAIRFTLDRMSQ
jgi:iron complex transport system ATP-binding protein